MSKNHKLLKNFTDYCVLHPDQRFWQALANWCGWNFVKVSDDVDSVGQDTFYFEGRKG